MRDDDSDHDVERPSGQFAGRSYARIAAFQLLYQQDVNPDTTLEWSEKFLNEELPNHAEILRFARSLINGVREKLPELDEKISAKSQNWSLNRMSITDRNILRMALYECLYIKTPKPVVIHESLELAKKFGSADSISFVNGILDRLL